MRGHKPLRPAPCRAVWPWETQFVCASDQAPNAESLNLINKDSCCTSTTAGHLCRRCHRDASSSYTKCITNIPQLSKGKEPHLASQLQWGFYAFPYERQLCASLPAEQLKNLVYIDKMFPCTESSFLTCENRARVVCANSGTYKWHSCVLRSQVENLAYSNFASFTRFITSSLTVLPYGLLRLCHSWLSFNGVNQEVTVKLMFAAKRPSTWQQKEVQIWRKG